MGARNGPRSGFTLIELLVVIAIIAILAAILFPVFMTARENARRAKCQAHVHELYAALMLYTDQYGKLPHMQFLTWRPGLKLYGPFVKNDDIILCPSGAWTVVSGVRVFARGAYAYNECLISPLCGNKYPGTEAYWPDLFPGRGRPLSDVRLVSKTPCFFDAFPYSYADLLPNGWGWMPDDAFIKDRMTNHHNGGANYVYLDGHARWLKPAGGSLYVAIEGIDYDGNGTLGSGRMLR